MIDGIPVTEMIFQPGTVTAAVFIIKMLSSSRSQRHEIRTASGRPLFSAGEDMILHRPLIVVHIGSMRFILKQLIGQLQHIIGCTAFSLSLIHISPLVSNPQAVRKLYSI